MNAEDLSSNDVLIIWKNVVNGYNEHGNFLRKFGEMVIAADSSNFQLVRKLSDQFIDRYKLTAPGYLEERN